MNRFFVSLALVFTMAVTTHVPASAQEVILECPNWGFETTIPSTDRNDPAYCVFNGPETVGTVPQGWTADTEHGVQRWPATFAATQVTLRPVDKTVTGVIAASQPEPVANVSQPAQPSTANVPANPQGACLVFNGVQTTPIGDGGCRYLGPIVTTQVPTGWLLWFGTPARWAMPGETVTLNAGSFYPD